MARFPFLGRLYLNEYSSLLIGVALLLFEHLIRFMTLTLPSAVIKWFHDKSRLVFHYTTRALSTPTSPESRAKEKLAERIRVAQNFEELCAIYGYTPEEHIVRTADGYLLGIHRLPGKRHQGRIPPGPCGEKRVVYLHHGLLMNSEVWVCLTDEQRSLPFVLVERGYDVWLGNNRGNKYSKKSMTLSPNSPSFWDFSLDDLCMIDIPDTLRYVLDVSRPISRKLSYIGFSQGSAQAFAALSVSPQLNNMVDVFIAIAPAFSPSGLSPGIVDALMKVSPNFLFLFLGRKVVLPSTVMWQSILYPPIFVKIIDAAIWFLFSWTSNNTSQNQKLAAYAHLYSFASVKCVVHWFQIMRTGMFQMYDDDAHSLYGKHFYHPAKFPCHNIMTPIVLLYGDKDSLVNIDKMLAQLPENTVARCLSNYEHMDCIWGENVHLDVIPKVIQALEEPCSRFIKGDVEAPLESINAEMRVRGRHEPPPRY